MVPQYIYSRLLPKHIRVLYVRENQSLESNSKDLVYSLKDIAFSPETTPVPTFEALSYSWGDLSKTFPLCCDGQELQIHHNLYEALPHLAHRGTDLPLWIDAICINQSDPEEKTEQLRMMAEIYSHASNVWIWLGPAIEPGSREAIEDIMPKVKLMREHFENLPAGQPFLAYEEFDLPAYESAAWGAFGMIVGNSWFSRLWVVQEAALARSISFLHGDYKIATELLEQVVNSMNCLSYIRNKALQKPRGLGAVLDRKPYQIFGIRNSHQRNERLQGRDRTTDASQVGLVWDLTRMHQCSEPKDRVFAMLGFISPSFRKDIAFTSETSVAELYMQFMHFILHRKDTIKSWNPWGTAFDMAIQQRSHALDLPSWCPDLHACADLSVQVLVSSNISQASSRLRCSRIGESPRELQVRGILFDSVTIVGQKCTSLWGERAGPENSAMLLDSLSRFREWEIAASKQARIISKLSEEEYFIALFAGEQHFLKPRPTFEALHVARAFLNEMAALISDIGRERLVPFLDGEDNALFAKPLTKAEGARVTAWLQGLRADGLNTPLQNVMNALCTVQQGRTIISTFAERFGSASGNMRTGDRVALFDGACIPYIVRRCPGGRETYQLIGVATIYGVMNGELDRLELEHGMITLV